MPLGLPRMTELLELWLANNKLIALPEDIGDSSRLITLDLQYNTLVFLPPSMGKMTKLANLHLTGNNFCSPPSDVIDKVKNTTLLLLDVIPNYSFRACPKSSLICMSSVRRLLKNHSIERK